MSTFCRTLSSSLLYKYVLEIGCLLFCICQLDKFSAQHNYLNGILFLLNKTALKDDAFYWKKSLTVGGVVTICHFITYHNDYKIDAKWEEEAKIVKKKKEEQQRAVGCWMKENRKKSTEIFGSNSKICEHIAFELSTVQCLHRCVCVNIFTQPIRYRFVFEVNSFFSFLPFIFDHNARSFFFISFPMRFTLYLRGKQTDELRRIKSK